MIKGIYRASAKGLTETVGTYQEHFETGAEYDSHISEVLTDPTLLNTDSIDSGNFDNLPEGEYTELIIHIEDGGQSVHAYELQAMALVEIETEN